MPAPYKFSFKLKASLFALAFLTVCLFVIVVLEITAVIKAENLKVAYCPAGGCDYDRPKCDKSEGCDTEPMQGYASLKQNGAGKAFSRSRGSIRRDAMYTEGRQGNDEMTLMADASRLTAGRTGKSNYAPISIPERMKAKAPQRMKYAGEDMDEINVDIAEGMNSNPVKIMSASAIQVSSGRSMRRNEGGIMSLKNRKIIEPLSADEMLALSGQDSGGAFMPVDAHAAYSPQPSEQVLSYGDKFIRGDGKQAGHLAVTSYADIKANRIANSINTATREIDFENNLIEGPYQSHVDRLKGGYQAIDVDSMPTPQAATLSSAGGLYGQGALYSTDAAHVRTSYADPAAGQRFQASLNDSLY